MGKEIKDEVEDSEDIEVDKEVDKKEDEKKETEELQSTKADQEGQPSVKVTGTTNEDDVGQRRIYFRKKVCKLCVRKVEKIDYKDVELLKRFTTDRGKILPRRITGTCARHQRILSGAIKRARFIALMPFESS